MKVRCFTLCLLFCLGCQSPSVRKALPTEPVPTAQPQPSMSAPLSRSESVKPSSEVVEAHHEETRPQPAAARPEDHLGAAAACIGKEDTDGAAAHLLQHLKAHPDQLMIRAYLAELLLKMKRLPEAQYHFEQFIADAQNNTGPARNHLLHCHTRLMEIAQQRDDDYAEHLHRGIGLLLLVRQLDSGQVGDAAEPSFRERMLCRASAELTKARKLRSDEPRPHWYLFEAWTKLEQPRAAEKSLKQAKALAALLPMTPAEQRALVLAQ